MNAVRGWMLGCMCLAGCGGPAAYDWKTDPYGIDPASIKFLDQADQNTDVDADLTTLEFTDRDGKQVKLKELAPGKTIVLVMTRGYTGSICPYCSTQVSRMIANYGEFEKRNAQVVVAYPLQRSEDSGKSEDFVKRAEGMLATKQKLPFPLVLDVELKAVNVLGIRKDLSKPATYILDAEGQVQFAYVSSTLADRPSVKALLEKLDQINQQGQRS